MILVLHDIGPDIYPNLFSTTLALLSLPFPLIEVRVP